MATVTIPQGKLKDLQSKTENDFVFYEFMGIPYAKPPVGNLRFKSPQPPESWKNERDATTVNKNNIASHFDFQIKQYLGSEDCLYLNVYTPKLPNSDSNPLPVMVYIHGGGFNRGNGITKALGGPNFLIEHNVVIVSINYRLSIFGFLNLGIPEAAGNMGLKDQAKALEWVQNNIAYFGGDKNNVTIFGGSAGSASVEHLVLSPMVKGRFHKAILQSGGSINPWAVNYEPKAIVLQVLKELGYEGSTEDSRAIHQYLTSTPAETLAIASWKVVDKSTVKRMTLEFCPTIEKDFGNNDAFLTDKPYKLMKEGKFNHVPMIRGYCNVEGYLINFLKPSAVKYLTETKKFGDLWPYKFEENDSVRYQSKLTSAYLGSVKADDELDDFAIDFFTDLEFAASAWIGGKLIASKGVPVYCYMFCYDGNANLFKKMIGMKRKGATHCDEIGYILSIEGLKVSSEADVLVKNRLTKMWADFAKTNNPTPATCDLVPVPWPTYTEQSQAYLNIDKEFTIGHNYNPDKIAVFEEIYKKYEQ